jgi:uncharacterized protein (DUF488 family)
MAHPFFSIGHSTRPLEQFADLLLGADVRMVIDVRTVPRSRRNAQFNRDTVVGSLLPFAIEYKHIAALGGLRGKQRHVSPSVNAFWQNTSFHNYADYAMGEEFHSGLTQLRLLGQAQRCAIMCAESLWWRCHRRIITDYLIAAGETVFHILGPDQIKPAGMTPAAKVGPNGTLTYPADA